MKFVLMLLAATSGIGSALQSGSNATLQKTIPTPLWTVVFVSGISLAAALLIASVAGAPFPARAALASPPWWAWLGGLFGVGFVYATIYVSPNLGAGIFVAFIVTASTLTSLILDNFGLMSFPVHKAGIGRILGGLLMAAGVACIAAF